MSKTKTVAEKIAEEKYSSNITKGKDFVKEKKYDEAISAFKDAEKFSTDKKEVTDLIKEAETLKAGKKPEKKSKGFTGFLKDLFSSFEEFASATLEDGTQVNYEGELAAETIVTVEVNGETIPMPDGTYNLGGDLAGQSITIGKGPNGEEGYVLEVGTAMQNQNPNSSEEMKAVQDEVKAGFAEILKVIKADKKANESKFEDIARAINEGKKGGFKFSRNGDGKENKDDKEDKSKVNSKIAPLA